MLVSFIIPAYNAADTIERCLESIYALPLKREEFEVIVIDDCSTDNTVSVIENFKLQVSNLILLTQMENHRQGAARNRGVKEARGEYICFVDADDAVVHGIVCAIRLAKEKQTDMLPYHLAYADENGDITREEDHLSYEREQFFSGIEMQTRHPYWLSGPVAYVYNRNFLERVNYPFEEDVLYEDSDFVVVHLYYANRMTYSSELGYKAYYRADSTTHQMSHKNIADYLLLGVRMMRFYESIVERGKTNVECREIEKFAEGILEGACYNVAISCKRIKKLENLNEVCLYYEHIDQKINRSKLCNDVLYRKYYWNSWTSICLKHRRLTMMILAFLIPMYKFVKRRK